MKAAYIKPTIKVRHIQAQENILAASDNLPESETLQIFSNKTIDNNKSLAKPNMINWDDEDE